MVETEWFLAHKGIDATGINGLQNLSRKRYPYFMDEAAFAALDDGTAPYEYVGRREYPDFIFEPTFMFSDRLQTLFHYLEPDMAFKFLHLLDIKKKDAPAPWYWVPFLPYVDAIHPASTVAQGKARELVLRRSALADRRIAHCRLPAEDIWLFSLEAAECLLRRCPMGVWMKKVAVRED